MKELSDERFGRIYQPASFKELIDLAVTSKTENAHIYMWRGQSNSEWLLHSAAYRRVSVSEKVVTERTMKYYEEYLLDKATHKGFRLQDGANLSDFELLARLQHHGAATRLLDTTRNVLVGLFFACIEISMRMECCLVYIAIIWAVVRGNHSITGIGRKSILLRIMLTLKLGNLQTSLSALQPSTLNLSTVLSRSPRMAA